jgi:tyrosine-protein kinase Etk/Wzc
MATIDPYKVKWGECRILPGAIEYFSCRKGLIAVTVGYKNPKLAANIANAYVEALQNFLNANAISLAKRNRIYLEKQLVPAKADLTQAEENLKSSQTNKKIMALDAQAEGAIKTLSELKAQIVAREIQLGAMREFAGKEHPEVMKKEDELREFRRQLKRLEAGSQDTSDGSLGAIITLRDAPNANLGYARLKRDALMEQKVFELLTQQYELAKIEEAKDDTAFQVIDSAVPPVDRIRPKRTPNVILAGLASLFLGVVVVFFQEYLEGQRSGQNR